MVALNAGVGSDHVDLDAAIKAGITVAEVTFCNSISVAEHVVMMILGLVRNYIPPHDWVSKGGWNIADCVARSYDVEGMHVGTVRSEEHTSELQSLMRISYAVFCLKKKKITTT